MFYRPGLQTKIAPPPSLAARHKNALGVSRTIIAGVWVAFFQEFQRWSCGQGVYEPVTTQEFLEMPRTDAEGNSVKLTVR